MTFHRRHVLLPVVVAVAVAAMPVHASSDNEAVARNLEAFRAAQASSDGAKLMALSTPELSYSHSDGRVENRITFIANAVKRTAGTVTYLNPNIRVVGNAAIVRFTWVPEVPADGSKAAPNLHILMVWQKQDNEWKLLARSATKL